MKTLNMDKKFFEGLAAYLENNQRIAIDPEFLELTLKGHYEHVGTILGANVKPGEPVSVIMNDYIEYTAAYREGADDSAGNVGIGITAHAELKKRIKSDETLEELEEDADDDEE